MTPEFDDYNYFHETTWPNLRNKVFHINKKLAEIIDAFTPGHNYPLFVAQYAYGAEIIKNRKLMLPGETKYKYIAIDDNDISPKIQTELNYGLLPVGLITQNSVEIYAPLKNRIIPLKLFKAGDMFGVCEPTQLNAMLSMQRAWCWDMSAGARSIFMLPKISDCKSHQRLSHKLSLCSPLPNNVFDQWQIFTEIAQQMQSNWFTEIIFFSKSWTLPHQHPAWFKLKNYWLEQGQARSVFWSEAIESELAWEAFIHKIAQKKPKPRFYALNTVRHFVKISRGLVPGFVPVEDNEITAPTKLIQTAYLNAYGLKYYAPILFEAQSLAAKNSSLGVYYSLQVPTLIETPFQVNKSPSALSELREITELLSLYIETIKQTPKQNQNIAYDLFDRLEFTCFHSEKNVNGAILNTSDLLNAEPRIIDMLKNFPGYGFPESSHYLRGCFKLWLK